MITATSVRTWELDRTPDLVDLVSAARDNGLEVLLIERPMPDAVSVAALGKAFDLVAAKGGVALEDASGKTVDFERGENRAASRSADSPTGRTATRAVRGQAFRRCCSGCQSWPSRGSAAARTPPRHRLTLKPGSS